MADSLGKVQIEIEARVDKLRAELETAKKEAAAAGVQIAQSVEQGTAQAGLGQSIKDAVAPVKQLQSAITSTLGIITGIVGSVTAVVGLLSAVGYGLYQWITSAERAAREHARIRQEIEATNDALLSDELRARLSNIVAGTEQELDLRKQILALEEEAAIVRARSALEQDPQAKALDDKIKELKAFRQKLVDANRFGTEGEIIRTGTQIEALEREYRTLFGDRIPRIQRTYDEGRKRIERQFADDRLRDMAREQETFNKIVEERANEHPFVIDPNAEARERQRKADIEAAQEAARIQRQAAEETARILKDAYQPLLSAINQLTNANFGGRIGQDARYLGQRLSSIERVAETIRRQQRRI